VLFIGLSIFKKGREFEGAPDEESEYDAGFDEDGRLERDPEVDMIVGREEEGCPWAFARPP
jgi:hypothetical protein